MQEGEKRDVACVATELVSSGPAPQSWNDAVITGTIRSGSVQHAAGDVDDETMHDLVT